jgi:NAD(P)-dependent dehydrogenase (short-subunit alcohol dehydrogenase family)
VMDVPPALSADGFEIHMAINHLAHAMLIQELWPVMLKTAAEKTDSDVRLICLGSEAWHIHPPSGIWFDAARTTQQGLIQRNLRYG